MRYGGGNDGVPRSWQEGALTKSRALEFTYCQNVLYGQIISIKHWTWLYLALRSVIVMVTRLSDHLMNDTKFFLFLRSMCLTSAMQPYDFSLIMVIVNSYLYSGN